MKSAALLFVILLSFSGLAQTLELPARLPSAQNGSEFARNIELLPLQEREDKMVSAFLNGNVPDFLRKLCSVKTTYSSQGKTNMAEFFVTPDYLAIGSNEDYFLAPLTPYSAQRIADASGCSLPTPKMVNATYTQAALKLSPSPIPPTPAMTTVPIFKEHNEIIRKQRTNFLDQFSFGVLTAGHKKDVVISKRLADSPNKVAIYGWHRTNGTPIQPLYLGHAASWVDYSHGVRLVQKKVLVNGEPTSIDEILRNAELTPLLSDEGVVRQSKYVFPTFPAAQITGGAASEKPVSTGIFQNSPHFDEQTMLLQLDHGVRAIINAPRQEQFVPSRKMKLVYYALPNGNTIEHTIGKQTATNEDWHFNIQHIGAQTRFLRDQLTNEIVVVAYLENSLKSWPAWRKKFGDSAVLKIYETILSRFEAYEPNIILTGHSGGGSFTFGYLNCVETISDDIKRIAFLDSNYAYETELHRDKCVDWLKRSPEHILAIFAYHDSIALLNGKTFVSAEGGTWGRSHRMKNDFEQSFKFSEEMLPQFEKHSALEGRLQFLLKQNPEKKIFHTVQVEKNGFIHAMLLATPMENRGYEYFGEHAYKKWIQPE